MWFTGCSTVALSQRYCFTTLCLLVRVNPVSGLYHNGEAVAVMIPLSCIFSRGFSPALRRGKCNAMSCDVYVLLQLMKFYSRRVANNRPFFLPFQEKLYIALYVFLMCCSVRCGVSEALLHAVFKKHLNRSCNPVVASEQLCNFTCTCMMKYYELLVVMHEPVVIRCTPTTLKSCNSPKLHVIINSSVVFTSFSH